MDPVELGREGESIIESTSDDQLLSEGSLDMNEIYLDPRVPPRVGDQYQVEIPPLMEESEHIQLMKQPGDTEFMVDQTFVIGLPIPIMWICEQVDKIRHEPLEFYGDSDVRRNISILAVSSHQHEEHSPDQMCSNKGQSAFPGSVGSSWSNLEVRSFLLSLYIFGKNLAQIQKFVETKEMGDVLSYYYGMFYKSNEYCRWSQCRKINKKKGRNGHGQRIFTGWRQRELLSRLSHSSKECQNTLSEVFKAFGEEKISLEELVSILKATVGMNALIEAVGIGKGKQDLASIVDKVKTTRLDIPTGKECNSLSSGDILKFLTGDFRLSKNKSSDLFWEAVWPRLLATGWHSEQPRNYVGSKNSLVFLIPGVKKYSKRRCVKGKHYFDSVTDVLNKVVSDPKLLDVEGETPKSEDEKEENGWDTEQKFDQNGLSDGRRQCYLQPHIPNLESDIVKFTVVDTSLVDGEGPLKVRELRTLPVDTIVSTPASFSRGTNNTNSSEEPEDRPQSADMLSNGQGDSNTSRPAYDTYERGLYTERSDCLLSDSKQERSINDLDIPDVPMEDHENQRANTCKDKHPSNTKSEFNQSGKLRQSNYLAPVSKRRRLFACGKEERSCSVSGFSLNSRLKEGDPCCSSDSPDPSENMVGLTQGKLSSGSSIEGSFSDCNEGIVSENGVVTAMFVENVERRPFIDLNLPDLQDFVTDEPVTTEMGDSQDDPIRKEPSLPIERIEPEESQVLETSNDMVNAEHEPTGRRQSTRNRPLTAKALEALANGYLSTKRKPRSGKSMLQENPISRPSRRSHGRSSGKGKFSDGGNEVVGKTGEGVDEECSSNTNIVSNFQVLSGREGSHELLGAASAACHPELSAQKDDLTWS